MRKYRRNSALQKVQTFDTLVTFTSGTGTGSIDFKVPVPDSRLRVKVSVMFIPEAGDVGDSGLIATLWLRECELDVSGVAGSMVPTANIEGSESGTPGPTAIPIATGLQGYSREFITAADYIVGTLDVSDGGPSPGGSWVLQCRYQPQSVRFSEEEWNEIEPNCNPAPLSSPLILGT